LGSSSAAIKAIQYAKTRGAKVINASWGSADCSLTLKAAIESLATDQILFVAAAGNNGSNIDLYPSYPASYGLAGVLSVAASTINFATANFSNYSSNTVHVIAPGQQILSTYKNGSQQVLSGTSMAAPLVSGAAALLWSKEPQLSLQEVRSRIMASVSPGPFPVVSRGELNIPQLLGTN